MTTKNLFLEMFFASTYNYRSRRAINKKSALIDISYEVEVIKIFYLLKSK